MRLILAIVVAITALVAVVVLVVDPRGAVPEVGSAVEQIGRGVEAICGETMRRSSPDLTWEVKGRDQRISLRTIETVALDELPFHNGQVVRVAGVLHVEFEWVALYPSRAAIEGHLKDVPWVALGSLWPDEPFWRTQGPSISDRCVVVEGIYTGGASGHFGMFNGRIGPVFRLDVWSTPHRPFDTTPPAPRPVSPPGSHHNQPSSSTRPPR